VGKIYYDNIRTLCRRIGRTDNDYLAKEVVEEMVIRVTATVNIPDTTRLVTPLSICGEKLLILITFPSIDKRVISCHLP